MLDHVSIPATDIAAAEAFYDAVMAAIGVTKMWRSEKGLGYGERCDAEHPDLNYLSIKLSGTVDQNEKRHWCFKAPDRAAVDAFWQAGLDNGGVDDGSPGIREVYHPAYYAAFLIDPSGNRVEAVCHRADG